MLVRRVIAAAALLVLVTGCGDDDGSGSDSNESEDDPIETQAQAILDCTTEEGLPGELTRTSDGIRAIDLTTEDQTIIVHLLESEEDATTYESDVLDVEPISNAAILGGAISPENRQIIVDCIEAS